MGNQNQDATSDLEFDPSRGFILKPGMDVCVYSFFSFKVSDWSFETDLCFSLVESELEHPKTRTRFTQQLFGRD